MGVISAAVDAAVALFSLTIVVAAPLFDAQSVLPHSLFPAPLLELKRWYAAEFGDYLVVQPPGFFRGLVWLEVAFHWPLAVATLFRPSSPPPLGLHDLPDGRRLHPHLHVCNTWRNVCFRKATPKLLQMYFPFAVFAVVAILLGLCSYTARTTASSSHGPSARKKRVYISCGPYLPLCRPSSFHCRAQQCSFLFYSIIQRNLLSDVKSSSEKKGRESPGVLFVD